MLKYYYPRTLKSITVALLDMFNDIRIVKYDKYNNPISEKTVPITFGPVEKYHQDRTEDHYYDSDGVEHNNRYYLQIPRMAIVLNGIAYDPDRATGVNEWRYWIKESLSLSDREADAMFSDYQPTPYNFNFTLNIKNDSMDYLSQILENILPYFNPALMLRVKEFSFLNVERDLPVILDGVSPEFIDDEQASDSRYVNASINFTVKGFMYRPVVHSKMIKYINSKYIDQIPTVLLETFQTSGFETSGGVLVTPSAAPHPGEFYTSGNYVGENKEFNWYKNYIYN